MSAQNIDAQDTQYTQNSSQDTQEAKSQDTQNSSQYTQEAKPQDTQNSSQDTQELKSQDTQEAKSQDTQNSSQDTQEAKSQDDTSNAQKESKTKNTPPKITIDLRERDLLKRIDTLKQKTPVPVTRVNLPIGDIIIERSGLRIIIERKTWPDLVASIHDGRYRDQKQRLKQFAATDLIVYIIEKRRVRRPSDVALVRSTVLSLGLRDGFVVVQTASLADTLDWTMSVYKKLQRDDFLASLRRGSSEELSNDPPQELSCGSKRNVKSANECLIAQLSQVPGVSVKTAKCIAETYESMADLCSRGAAKDIAELRVGSRRIGVKRAERIAKLLGLGNF